MKKILVLVGVLIAIFAAHTAFAQSDLTIRYNGDVIEFSEQPLVLNNKTLVQVRPIAEAMGLKINFVQERGKLNLSNSEGKVVFTLNSNVYIANEIAKIMDAPMVAHNNYTFVPVRELAEPFGMTVIYDSETKSVDISSEDIPSEVQEEKKTETPEKPQANEAPKETELPDFSAKFIEGESVYFYQAQPEIALPENGKGYCWVCSYAMMFSNMLKTVITPMEIAQYNIDRGYAGNYMAGHADLALSYGLRHIPAISEDSPYYVGFNVRNRGETEVFCETDEDARIVMREAIDKFPQGVIVRYDGYPHSMLAVAYDEDYIYFNDPGIQDGEYVTFEKTCLKNFKISDISSIQAFEVR